MKSIILCGLLTVLCATASAQLSQITVKSNRFVTADGKAIVFHGLATSDPDKLQRNDQWNKRYFEEAKAWGANIVRFPVHPAAWRIHGEEGYLKLLDQGVALAKEQGLYVMMDWHSIGNLPGGKFFSCSSELYPPTAYHTTKAETFHFWRTLAKHYSKENAVAFFELFNEPALGGSMGTATWSEWKALLEELIAAIRAEGGTAIPLVAGFDFGYDLRPVAESPLNAEGIGYVSHPYPMKAKKPLDENWTRDWGFVAEKYPLFLSEFGYVGPDDKKGYNPIFGDESYGDALMAYCTSRGISYTVWCFDPNWEPSLINDWNFAPTRQGTFFKKVMQSKER
jgi:endoglucanase